MPSSLQNILVRFVLIQQHIRAVLTGDMDVPRLLSRNTSLAAEGTLAGVTLDWGLCEHILVLAAHNSLCRVCHHCLSSEPVRLAEIPGSWSPTLEHSP